MTLWKWLRLPNDELANLLAGMSVSDNAVVQATANEAANMLTSSPKTFASVLSSAHQFTDFLKSLPLQRSLVSSSFDIRTISEGTTTMYVVIPPDLLVVKAAWLRLIISSVIRSVTQNPAKKVTLIMDEFSSIGYIREVETAINTLSGYNLTLWPILTSLEALKRHYPNSWNNFIANASVCHFSSIQDDATASHVSSLAGDTTFVTMENGNNQATARRLLTPDEVRRGSADHIFTFIEQRPIAEFWKLPYYAMPDLEGRYDPNPYYTGQ